VYTALHEAAKVWRIQGSVSLLRHGSDKQARDNDRCTPEDFVKGRRVELLL